MWISFVRNLSVECVVQFESPAAQKQKRIAHHCRYRRPSIYLYMCKVGYQARLMQHKFEILCLISRWTSNETLFTFGNRFVHIRCFRFLSSLWNWTKNPLTIRAAIRNEVSANKPPVIVTLRPFSVMTRNSYTRFIDSSWKMFSCHINISVLNVPEHFSRKKSSSYTLQHLQHGTVCFLMDSYQISLVPTCIWSMKSDFPVISLRYMNLDRLCGLVVRVLGYRSGGPGSIPGTTRKKK
jgi:hypothetical protein